jgi:ribosomal protein S18 acetylase RimI-like enzyme
MGSVRTLGADELSMSRHPFVRHQVDPVAVTSVWESDGAVVVEGGRRLPGRTGQVVFALGPEGPLRSLANAVAGSIAPPSRVSVEAASLAALPPAWRQASAKRWHWMLTRQAPGPVDLPVVEVTDHDEVDALLDQANPDAHARPGMPEIECWMGVRSEGRLIGVGAVSRQADGTGHLRAVTVLPSLRGRGLGTGLSAALTARALAGGSGVATLGVYVDNHAAVGIYRRLGYRVLHTFASGPVRT